MSKISDFHIPKSILMEASKAKKIPFVDLEIAFEEPLGNLKDGRLCVGETKVLGQTLFNIVRAYTKYQSLATGEQGPNAFLIYVATLIRKAVISDDEISSSKPDELFLQRLYQRPLVWSIMKNLICPLHDKQAKNVLLACGTSPYTDTAHYYKKGEVRNPKAPSEEFIFVNDDTENIAVKNAILLYEAIRAHDLSPQEVVKSLFDGEMYQKLLGIVKMSLLKNEKVEEFVAVLFAITGLSCNLFPHVEQEEGKIVVAQGSSSPGTPAMQWWYSGLTEKMLDTVRGPDWSTRMALEGMVQEFWDQVEMIKSKKAQGDGVPFNDLLRLKQVQTSDPRKEPEKTIQSLLSEQRIY